jgi:hypothetical protein
MSTCSVGIPIYLCETRFSIYRYSEYQSKSCLFHVMDSASEPDTKKAPHETHHFSYANMKHAGNTRLDNGAFLLFCVVLCLVQLHELRLS